VWLTPQTVNKPQCLCVSDFVPTPDHDNVQSLVANVNDSIDRQQLKGTDLTSAFYASPARCCPLLQQYSCSVVCLFEMEMDKRQKRLNRTVAPDVCGVNSCGPKEPLVRWGQSSRLEGAL